MAYVSASEDRVTCGRQPNTLAGVNKVSHQFREILSGAKWYPEAAVSLDNITLALPLVKDSLTRRNMLSFPNSSQHPFPTLIHKKHVTYEDFATDPRERRFQLDVKIQNDSKKVTDTL